MLFTIVCASVCLWIIWHLLLTTGFSVNNGFAKITTNRTKTWKDTNRTSGAYAGKNQMLINDKTMIMSVMKLGRFGNNMFQYAALRGLAHSMGYKPVLPMSFMDLEKAFDLPVTFVTPQTLAEYNFTTHVENWNSSQTSPNNTMLAILDENGTHIMLKGFFQSYWYFENVKKYIRRDFEFRSSVKLQVKEFFYW